MQRPAEGCVDSLQELSISQLLDHIVRLCSSMHSAFSTDATHGRSEDFLKLLEQERTALMMLERRMDSALADGADPDQIQQRLVEVENAHRRCQDALQKRVDATRTTLQKVSALEAGQQSYREQAP